MINYKANACKEFYEIQTLYCHLSIFFFFISVTACLAVTKRSGSKFNKRWDFSDGKLPKEWLIRTDNWKIENEKLVVNDKLGRAGMLVSDVGPVSDFAIEADIKINNEYLKTNSTWAGFHFRSDNILEYAVSTGFCQTAPLCCA